MAEYTITVPVDAEDDALLQLSLADHNQLLESVGQDPIEMPAFLTMHALSLLKRQMREFGEEQIKALLARRDQMSQEDAALLQALLIKYRPGGGQE